jgi:hypothetical protein
VVVVAVRAAVVVTVLAAAGWSGVVVAAQAAAGWLVVAGWVRPVAVCLTVRPAVADSCAVPAAQGISAHRVAVAERRASLARLAAAVAVGSLAHPVAVAERRASLAHLAVVVAVGSLVLSVDYGLALVLVRVAVLLSVRRMARRQVRASAVRPCISLVVGCGSSITATSTFLCRLLAPGFGVTILAGGTPIGGGSTATTADTRP